MATPIRRPLSVAGVAALLVAAPAAAAHAEPDSDEHTISRYAVEAVVDPGGGADVTVDLDLDLGSDDEAHGPFVSIVERQEIEGDPDRYRLTPVGDIAVTSDTGAPTDLLVEREDGGVVVRIGDEDVEISGVQSYTVTYRIEGLAAPSEGPGAPDALVWNAVGLGWELPMRDVSVSIEAPAGATSARCVAGGVGSTRPCASSAASSGTSTTATQDALEPGQGLTIAVEYPAGTFPDAEVRYEPRRTWGNTFGVTPATGGIGGAAVVGGVAALAVARHRRRDDDSPAATTGAPTSGTDGVPEGFATEPPADVPPGEFGTLIDERAQHHDVVAVLLDLAVRGVLHLEVVLDDDETTDDTPGDATDDEPADLSEIDHDLHLIRVPGAHDLRPYERELVEAIFDGADEIVLSERAQEVAKAVESAAHGLDDAVTQQGWFAGSPRRVRARWLLGGFGLLFGGWSSRSCWP
ncbi:hypothetical protein GCM10025875_19950 [Litorihabitans aurantiacus]|uniref:DUF2207 domain-containing protein n=1 Tax=Litorihabitans aurantiacus TaxID=1930061 RepID=A0AA38CPV6_9MICO|nr:DUF2207 domain-containing protein [Litorihabitans aurantiacus]GMA32003.1 hypothetical protein GCM10025875_19950 [Litorihabitans aurantiacus]